MATYKYDSAQDWLEQNATIDRLMLLIPHVDGDTIQDLFQIEMKEDGYFEPQSGVYRIRFDENVLEFLESISKDVLGSDWLQGDLPDLDETEDHLLEDLRDAIPDAFLELMDSGCTIIPNSVEINPKRNGFVARWDCPIPLSDVLEIEGVVNAGLRRDRNDQRPQ